MCPLISEAVVRSSLFVIVGRRRASSTVANSFIACTPTSESGLRYTHAARNGSFRLAAAYASDRGSFYRVGVFTNGPLAHHLALHNVVGLAWQ